MERPTFEKLQDAHAWITEDAISRALLPFRAFYNPDELEIARDFLEMLVASHAEVRALATRAAKTLLPLVERPLKAAARRRDPERAVPLSPVEEVLKFEPGLVGKPKLTRPEFFKPSLAVVKSIAKYVATAWKRQDFDDLVGDAWVVVLEAVPEWDESKASYVTFIWGRVRNRLINYCKKFSNCRESTACYKWTDKVREGQFSSKDPAEQLYEALDAAAMSYGLALLHSLPKSPEEEAQRRETVKAMLAGRERLPERQQKVLARHYDDNVLLSVVAQELGISQSTVERDHHEALFTLRRAIETGSNVRTLGAPRPPPPALPLPKKPPKKRSPKPALRLVTDSAKKARDDDD